MFVGYEYRGQVVLDGQLVGAKRSKGLESVWGFIRRWDGAMGVGEAKKGQRARKGR